MQSYVDWKVNNLMMTLITLDIWLFIVVLHLITFTNWFQNGLSEQINENNFNGVEALRKTLSSDWNCFLMSYGELFIAEKSLIILALHIVIWYLVVVMGKKVCGNLSDQIGSLKKNSWIVFVYCLLGLLFISYLSMHNKTF